MSDHKTEALEALSEIMLHFDEGENGTARATIAQVHATLYLAEQQRIANLIEVSKRVDVGVYQSVEDERGYTTHTVLSPWLNEGLGLS